jgi:CRISPR system Cascade subunit CasB
MSKFIEWLESLNEKDSKVRAVLRRSLAFDPGGYVPAFPYVEPFLKDGDSDWRREVHYLVAGLWAMHWREGRNGQLMPIGEACAIFDKEKRSKMNAEDQRKLTSTEKRFINMLDADADQLPYRLRQMVALLKDHQIDFEHLLQGLLYWDSRKKGTQNTWARNYYRHL